MSTTPSNEEKAPGKLIPGERGTHTSVTFADLPLTPPKDVPYVEVEVDVQDPGTFVKVFPIATQNKLLQGTPLARPQLTARATFVSDPHAPRRRRHFLFCPAGIGLPNKVDNDGKTETMRLLDTFLHPQIGIPFGMFEIEIDTPAARVAAELALKAEREREAREGMLPITKLDVTHVSVTERGLELGGRVVDEDERAP